MATPKSKTTISQLAKYGLDYVSLISSSSSRARPVETDKIDADILSALELFFEDEQVTAKLRLITSLDKKYKPDTKQEEKSSEQIKAEKILTRHRKIFKKLQEIDTKIKTNGYTKRIVLQSGLISFETKRLKDDEFSEEYEKYEGPLYQIPVTGLGFSYVEEGVTVELELEERYLEALIDPLKNYLPQLNYDKIFELLTDAQKNDKHLLPSTREFTNELWSATKTYLESSDARSISEVPSFEHLKIAIAGKTNHFLAEDLKAILELDEEELLETSLSSWVDDKDMAVEQEVSDNGSTEIFFPFPYDKYQLKVLGVTENRAMIVEGPPGTGKSQTISNLLVHLAATGKRVLFASQKDQAIRGVKDKLKTLDVPFLYGYIPDKTSKLYTEEDEKDSAANTLVALNKEFQKGRIGDLKAPLKLIHDRTELYNNNLENQRNLYALFEERRKIDYLDNFYEYGLDIDFYNQCTEIEKTINELSDKKSELEETSDKTIKAGQKKYSSLDIDEGAVSEAIDVMTLHCKNNIPERASFFSSKINDVKLKNKLKDVFRTTPQEIYVDVEKILFSEETKSTKIKLVGVLRNYFLHASYANEISTNSALLDKTLKSKKLSANEFGMFKSAVDAHGGPENTFKDLAKYEEITTALDEAELYSANKLNEEIKDVKKYYKNNTTNYVRNRILTRVTEANSDKNTRAILAQVSKDLRKSKKANKTFDKLKHHPDKFNAMTKVLPIWMMSLDDVSRIVPTETNAFDYVIIDEASQCNFAYAFPAMYRARHTIFFGDSLQMRDDNIMFKSNDQLKAIAEKNNIPEAYQIKPEESAVNSVMDIGVLNGFKNATLKYHYRSPQELIGFSNKSFYEPIGRNLESVNDNIVPYKDTGRVLLSHIVQPNNDEEIGLKTNIAEVKKVVELIEEIKQDSVLKDKSIAVLTFFNEQAEELRKAIDDQDIKVSIIDGIQGDERDIIIYSFVLKDPSDKRRYVKMTGEGGEINKSLAEGRVNVAFSRAKLQVHCVTSLPAELWPDGIWIKQYLEYVEKYGVISRRHNAGDQQFDSKFEENVFTYLAKNLDARSYKLATQINSLGFKIDLVVSKGGRRLAIECDGPTHFEDGDGQVYVKSDWERQGALETAGWNFYRISYYDWVMDTENEKEALIEYIEKYFNDSSKSKKSDLFKELEKSTSKPEEEAKELYTTDFSGEHVDNVTPVNVRAANYQAKTSTKKNADFSVGGREVNQEDFENYLKGKSNGMISIRYQSPRKGSSNKWRSIHVTSYDKTYIYSSSEEMPFIKYRRDRVVEFK